MRFDDFFGNLYEGLSLLLVLSDAATAAVTAAADLAAPGCMGSDSFGSL